MINVLKFSQVFSLIILTALLFFAGCSNSITDYTAPGEVSGLSAVSGTGQVTLRWSEPADVDFDHVKISYGIGGTADTDFSNTANPSATVISGLINCKEYTFVVKTVDTKGNVSTGTTMTTTPGFITYDGDSGADAGYSVALDDGDNTLIAGSITDGTDKDMAIWRYLSSGAPDTSFGTDGVVIYDGSNGDDYGRSIEIDSTGNVLVTGEIMNGTDKDMAVWRYTSSGVLDASFGRGGCVIYDGGNGDDYGLSAVLDSGGKVVVAGAVSNGTDKDMALWRYTSSGVLDTSFGTDGVVIYDGSNGDDYGRSIKLDSAGNVLVAGEITNANKDMALWRYTSSGVLDTGFGTEGLTAFHNGIADIGYSLAIDENGKLLIAGFVLGSDSFDRYIWRYNSSGVLDSGFGSDGVASYSSGRGADMGYSVAVDANGRLVVAGYVNNGTDWDMTVLRYTSSGDLDTNFGINGAVTYYGGNGNDTGLSTAIDTNGNIVVAGYFNNGTDVDMALWYVR